MNKIKRAVISVSDKEGISDFAKGLSDLGVSRYYPPAEQRKNLETMGVEVTDISEFTGSPEILGRQGQDSPP